MERLDCVHNETYSPIEATIHVGRYAPVLPLCPGKRVLDIACGEGYGSYLLKTAGAAAVEAVDVNAAAVDRARSLFRQDGLTYQAADAHRVAELFKPKSFDIVISIETLEHLDDPVTFLRGLRRVVKDDGLIYLTCPNDHWYYPGETSNPYHLRKYTLAEFQELAAAELGGAVRWYYGVPVGGFLSLPLDESPRAENPDLPAYAQTRQLDRLRLVPADARDTVDAEHSSYFIGVWNGGGHDFRAGALYPMSMDSYSHLHANAQVVADNKVLSSENERLRAVEQEAFRLKDELHGQKGQILELEDKLKAKQAEMQAQDWELRAQLQRQEWDGQEKLRQEQARLLAEKDAAVAATEARITQELRVWRAQATALRYESDLLQENHRKLRDEHFSLNHDRNVLADTVTRLQEALSASEILVQQRWDIIAAQGDEIGQLRHSVDSLKEALAATEIVVQQRWEIITAQGEEIARLRAPIDKLRRCVPGFLKPLLRKPYHLLRRLVG